MTSTPLVSSPSVTSSGVVSAQPRGRTIATSQSRLIRDESIDGTLSPVSAKSSGTDPDMDIGKKKVRQDSGQSSTIHSVRSTAPPIAINILT